MPIFKLTHKSNKLPAIYPILSFDFRNWKSHH